jgi:hypothetical protein
MPQCTHRIDYGNGVTAHCSLSEHMHIFHEWQYDDPQPVAPEIKLDDPSLPDVDDWAI